MVVAAVVNDMKSDLTLGEFDEAVRFLAAIRLNGARAAATEVQALQVLTDGLTHFRR